MRRCLAVLLAAFLISGVVPHAQQSTPPFPSFPVWITPPTFISGAGIAAGSITIPAGSVLKLPDGTAAAPSLTFASETGLGLMRSGLNQVRFVANSQTIFTADLTTFSIPNGVLTLAGDTVVQRDAPNTLALKNGSNNQTFNVYNSSGAIGSFVSGTTVSAGTTYQVAGNAFGTSTIGPSSVAGTTITANLVMAGLGGSFTTRTGRFEICMSGNMDNSTTNDGAKAQISFGTTVPVPTLNAPLQGTQVGPIQQSSQATLPSATLTPFGACWIVTGQAVNTAFWTDIAYAAVTAGTAILSQAAVVAHDLP